MYTIAISCGVLQMLIYSVIPAGAITDEQLKACSQLFSKEYGVWGANSKAAPGSRVRLSPARLREQCVFNGTCSVVIAKLGDELVGHAFTTKFWYAAGESYVSWITQLVVSSDHRSRGVASSLCRHAWDINADFACGLVTSHPHAVRALERATRRVCDTEAIMAHGDGLAAASGIPYLKDLKVSVGCKINTSFFVDHTEVNILIEEKIRAGQWDLGRLQDGEEFFAFTFASSLSRHRSEESAAVDSQQPAVDSQQPAVGSQQPAVDNQQPAVDNQQPVTFDPTHTLSVAVVICMLLLHSQARQQ